MTILAELKCTVCRSGDDPMSKQEIGKNLQSIPEWELISENKTNKLKRIFNFGILPPQLILQLKSQSSQNQMAITHRY
jgi:hypothetical protein